MMLVWDTTINCKYMYVHVDTTKAKNKKKSTTPTLTLLPVWTSFTKFNVDNMDQDDGQQLSEDRR